MPIFDSTDQDGAAVRAFLRDQARELAEGSLQGPGYDRGQPVEVIPVDIDAELAAGNAVAQLFADVFGYVALRDGEPYRLQRRDLPEWHAARWVGHFGDDLVLGVDDVLVPVA